VLKPLSFRTSIVTMFSNATLPLAHYYQRCLKISSTIIVHQWMSSQLRLFHYETFWGLMWVLRFAISTPMHPPFSSFCIDLFHSYLQSFLIIKIWPHYSLEYELKTT
jgi:hypothetical protein